MLKVWMGRYEEDGVTIAKSDFYFDNMFDNNLLLTDFSRRLIEECSQGSKVIAPGVLEHPERGCYAPMCLPTGVKTTLLTMYNEEVITDMVYCGDNCIPYIVEASREKDITVYTERFIYWFELYCRNGVSEILIMNTGNIVRNYREYFDAWIEHKDDITIKEVVEDEDGWW